MKKKFQKQLAINQILLLVVSIVAVGYILGSEIPTVSGAGASVGTYFWETANRNNEKGFYYYLKKSDGWYVGKSDILNKIPGTLSKSDTAEDSFLKILENGKSVQDDGKEITIKSGVLSQTSTSAQTSSAPAPPATPTPVANPTPPTATPGAAATEAAATATATLAVAEQAKKPLTAEEIAAKCKTDEKFAKSPVCSSYLSILGESLLYAGVVYGGIKLFGPILGLGNEQTEAVSRAFAIGTLAGKSLGDIGAKKGWSWATEEAGGLSGATWVGIGVAAAYFLVNYKQQDSKTVRFSCVPWQAPIGGNNCEQCNKQFLPCSEYQCKSLGQNCELENKGTSDEKCVWVNRNDVTAPEIQALEQALLNDKYSYNPDSAILPPDRGVKILFADSEDNCVPAFTPLRFGISSNEPARCKLDILRKDKFEDMDTLMSSGLLQYNHTFSLSLPGSANLNSSGIELENGGDYELFARCEDANGNSNIGTFVFKYCVQKGPDTTPPLIVATSLPDNAPIAFNQSSVNLQVYVNEPSECSWSHNNRDYNSMENKMDCNTGINDANSQGLYSCGTNLTGLKDRFTNTFYIRCSDQPQKTENERNANSESFILNILGTQPLVIDEIQPEDEIIKDSTSPVKVTFDVKTSAGYDLGKSLCYYSDTGNDDDYVKFFETDSFQHKQELFLPAENYTYYIRCVDLGGNSDDKLINFSIETDNQSPIVVRATHEEQYLKIITNEDAKCVYDIVDCSYPIDGGKPLTEIDGKNHFTDWNIQSNVYIKCQDSYGNQPLPNQCSIIIKSADF